MKKQHLEHLLRAAIPARTNVVLEDQIRFGWNPNKVMLFDATTGVNLRHKAA